VAEDGVATSGYGTEYARQIRAVVMSSKAVRYFSHDVRTMRLRYSHLVKRRHRRDRRIDGRDATHNAAF